MTAQTSLFTFDQVRSRLKLQVGVHCESGWASFFQGSFMFSLLNFSFI